jgi:hypothetical protein
MKRYSHILLVSGSGRKAGKTSLVCEIIKNISSSYPLVAVKISPHFYSGSINPVFYSSEDIIIEEERNPESDKDSSRMLKAGARKVYFIQARDAFIKDAFEKINVGKDIPVICESGGAAKSIIPGFQIFVCHDSGDNRMKNHEIPSQSDLVIRFRDGKFDFDISRISFSEHTWKIRTK